MAARVRRSSKGSHSPAANTQAGHGAKGECYNRLKNEIKLSIHEMLKVGVLRGASEIGINIGRDLPEER